MVEIIDMKKRERYIKEIVLNQMQSQPSIF